MQFGDKRNFKRGVRLLYLEGNRPVGDLEHVREEGEDGGLVIATGFKISTEVVEGNQ